MGAPPTVDDPDNFTPHKDGTWTYQAEDGTVYTHDATGRYSDPPPESMSIHPTAEPKVFPDDERSNAEGPQAPVSDEKE